ncbi:BppU family phage baseplate upper protein, partial [Enterococcus devriesei]|uniref:BppU family phage baseplate upper protein n=3 Tax=Enterococcus devriesei TaxID=319970 RepID=UPI0035ED93EF
MFKTNEEIIIIQAKATTPIPTGVVFWSHDKGTAKMLFQLQKDYVNQTLSEGTIVPICLDFVGGRHIYHAVIEDAVNGIVSIVLEDNILGYVGRVTGSIYIELPDSRSLDTAGRFTFDIKRSPIDENVPELEDYYWQGFNEIMAQYRQTIATIKLEAKELLDSLTADVTTAQSKVAKLEQSITTANTNLNARIDEISKKIDDNDVFTKAESSANVIDQVIGNETSTRNITTDMKNKVATSVIENPNLAFTSYGATELLTPENGFETPQSSYDEISAVDTRIFTLTRSEANKPSQLLISWDILTIAKKNLG